MFILEGQDFCSCRTFHSGLYPILQDTLASKKTFIDHSDTLFSLLLSDEGCKEFDIRRNREDAIICESMNTCEDKSWSKHYIEQKLLNNIHLSFCSCVDPFASYRSGSYRYLENGKAFTNNC